MKIFLKLLVTSIVILPFTINVISCKKNDQTNVLTSSTVISKLNSDNNKMLNLQNNNSNIIDLSNLNICKNIYNALNLSTEEQKFISSINSYNKIFYINNFKTITFNIKKDLNSETILPIMISLKWTNDTQNIQNTILQNQIGKKIKANNNLIINDQTISSNKTTINLNNSAVKNAILTKMDIDRSLFYYIVTISNNTNNVLTTSIESNVLFMISNHNGFNLPIAIKITWCYQVENSKILFNQINNQINNLNIIYAQGDNLNLNYLNLNTSKNILQDNIGLFKDEADDVTIKGTDLNLILNKPIVLSYIISVANYSATITKETILLNQTSPFINSDVTTTIYDSDNSSYYSLVDNNIWQYDLINNNFNKLTKNSVFDNQEIVSIFYYQNNLYVDFKFFGIGKLDLNNVLQPIFNNIPDYINCYYSNDNLIYLGSKDQGLANLNSRNGEVNYYQNKKQKNLPNILSIFKSFDNKLYCGIAENKANNQGGIWFMQQQTPVQYLPSVNVLSNLSVYKVVNISNVIYAMTSNGIYYLTSTMTKFSKLITRSLIDQSCIISYYYSNDILYLGTSENGLWSLDLNTNNNTQLTSLNILKNSKINDIFLQNNILIINKSENDIKNIDIGQFYYSII